MCAENRRNEYYSIDPNPYSGVSYYRLKQTDYDGAYSYSDVIAVNLTDEKRYDFTLFPNPNDGNKFSLNVFNNSNTEILINIYNVQEKLVYTTKNQLAPNNTMQIIDITPSHLVPGVYGISAICGNEISTQKLIVK